jgi:hypothetical protein
MPIRSDPHHPGELMMCFSNNGQGTWLVNITMTSGTGVLTVGNGCHIMQGSANNSFDYNPIIPGQGVWTGGVNAATNHIIFMWSTDANGKNPSGTHNAQQFGSGSSANFNGSIRGFFDPNPSNGGKLILLWANQLAGTGHCWVQVCTVTGQTINFPVDGNGVITQDQIVTSGKTLIHGVAFHPNNDGTFMADCANAAGSVDTDIYMVPGTLSGTTFTLDFNNEKVMMPGTYVTAPRGPGKPVFTHDLFDNTYFIAGFRDINDNYAPTYIYGVHGMSVTGGSVTTGTQNLTDEAFIGYSDATYTDGQTATINLGSGTDDNQTGLTIGSTYYVQLDGTLGTTPASPSVLAGKAIKTTEILINR